LTTAADAGVSTEVGARSPVRPSPPCSGTVTVRLATAAALGFALALAFWDFAGQLDGSTHVVARSSATADGGTVGAVLATGLWLALAIALVGGILLHRRQTREVGLPVPGAAASSATSAPYAVAAVAVGGAFVLAVYHGLLLPGAITWGDWGYYANSGAVRAFFPVPSLWSFDTLGTSNILGAPLLPVESAMGALAHLGVSYDVLERMWFYYPAVALAYAGPVVLLRRLRVEWGWAAAAGAFYCVNPYTLVLVSGGQLTVGVGYALYPWVAVAVISLWSRRTLGRGAVVGAVIGVQAWYEPRTAGLSIAGLAVAAAVAAVATSTRRAVRQVPWAALFAGGLVFVLLQGPWLVPALFSMGAQLPAGYTTTSALQSLSLISLADGLTVFHPFWPRMQFIALFSVPAVWFSVPAAVAIALRRAPRSPLVHAGTAVYLVFAALVSGANVPFGPMNEWLFAHVPGMNLFRDPSPYFGPAALAVTVVACVGFSATRPVGAMRSATVGDVPLPATPASLRPSNVSWAWARLIVLGLCLVVVAVSGWPGLSGGLRHNLAPQPVPSSFRLLDRHIATGAPGAVLWIPSPSRFALVSPLHPNVSAVGLEGTAGIGFPSTPQQLDWLTDPQLVAQIMARYNIAEVVVLQGAAAYSDVPLSYGPTLSATRSAFAHDRSWHAPGLTLYHLSGALPSPLAVVPATQVAVGVPSDVGGLASGSEVTASLSQGQRPRVLTGFSTTAELAARGATSGPEELAHTGFSDGLAGWQPVGDGNNYLHQSLQQAGISAQVQHQGAGSWLHLTVAYGAATMAQPLVSCPTGFLQVLTVTYRTPPGVSLAATVFANTQVPPLGESQLPSTGGHWRSAAVPMYVVESSSAERRAAGWCLFSLSLSPINPGQAVAADVRQVSLTTAPSQDSSGHPIVKRSLATGSSLVPRQFSVSPTGETMQFRVAAAAAPQLVVLWQRFNPSWVATTASGARLAHVVVNGWANGYVVPAGSARASYVIRYAPVGLVVDGYVMLLAGLAVLVAFGAAALWRRDGLTRVRQQSDT
jgi:hypothetical protein